MHWRHVANSLVPVYLLWVQGTYSSSSSKNIVCQEKLEGLLSINQPTPLIKLSICKCYFSRWWCNIPRRYDYWELTSTSTFGEQLVWSILVKTSRRSLRSLFDPVSSWFGDKRIMTSSEKILNGELHFYLPRDVFSIHSLSITQKVQSSPWDNQWITVETIKRGNWYTLLMQGACITLIISPYVISI